MICFIDFRATNEELNNLIKFGIEPIKVPKTNLVYDAICGHVDIQMNVLDKKQRKVIVQKDISKDFLKILHNKNIEYILSTNSLKTYYPYDIPLNGLITDDIFMHNIKFTDKTLLKEVQNKKIINVKQGYTKCSVLPINKKAFITNDKSISKSLTYEGFDVLLVPPKDILLPSMNYGFIGGVGGMVSIDTLALFGDLKEYKYHDLIIDFLDKYNIKVLTLSSGKLVDRGSLFVI